MTGPTTAAKKATDIGCLLDARSIAVVGASSDPAKIGGRPIAYLLRGGYSGRIVPVNPMHPRIQGIAAVKDIRDAEPVDLAIIATPAAAADDAVAACVQAGAKGIILFTAGYAEADMAGAGKQAELVARAQSAGAVMLGPNCLGAINFHTGLIATFTTALEIEQPRAGGFSYFGQSGALGAYWIEMAARAGLGLGKWLSTGNEAQVNSADALAYLANDPDTKLIAAYFEDIKDPENFAIAADIARANGKRIIALKSGQSAAGKRAARAHTASQPGDDGWYEELFARHGIIRVRSLSEMIDTATLLSSATPFPTSDRLAFVTVSGGAGILMCDSAAEVGLGIAEFSPALTDALRTILPGFAQPQNPIDVTGAVLSDHLLMPHILDLLANSGECDGIVLFIGAMDAISDTLLAAIAQVRDQGFPLTVIWMAAPAKVRPALQDLGIPLFSDIPPAMAAIAAATRG
ncbi:MAG: CoA-binding protein [Sphingobium sp.]